MEEDHEDYKERNNFQAGSEIAELTKSVWRYGAPCLLIFGTFSNLLAFIVLQRKSFRKGSVGFALSFLTVINCLLQWTVLYPKWKINQKPGVDIINLSECLCKGYFFAQYYLSNLSSWTVAIFSVDRAVTIVRPFAARWIKCGRRRMMLALSIAAILLAIVNIHFFWSIQFISRSFKTPLECNTLESLIGLADENNTLYNCRHPKLAGNDSILAGIRNSCGQYFGRNNLSMTTNQPSFVPDAKARNASLFFTSFPDLQAAEQRHHLNQLLESTTMLEGSTDFPLPMSSTFSSFLAFSDNSTNSGNVSSKSNVTCRTMVVSKCRSSDKLNESKNILHWFDAVVRVLLPFLFISSSNVVVMVCIWKAKKAAKDLTRMPWNKGKEKDYVIAASTVMLLVVSLIFLLTTTPLAVLMIRSIRWVYDTSDVEEFSLFELIKCICTLIYSIGNCLNFIIFCVSGSRFRQAARETLHGIWKQICEIPNHTCRHRTTVQHRLRAMSTIFTEYTSSSIRSTLHRVRRREEVVASV